MLRDLHHSAFLFDMSLIRYKSISSNLQATQYPSMMYSYRWNSI